MESVLVARVAVAGTTRVYDCEYDYVVPAQFAGQIVAGRRVLVPFGKKNIERNAFVLSVYESPQDIGGGVKIRNSGDAYEIREGGADKVRNGGADKVRNGVTLKPLIRPMDDAPLLTEADIALAAKIREKYNCIWFDAFSCILPVGWNRKNNRLLADGISASGGCADAALQNGKNADAAPQNGSGAYGITGNGSGADAAPQNGSSVDAAPQNGIHLLNDVVMDSRSEVEVRSESLLRIGTPRRMDSKSFRPPPLAHESTNVSLLFLPQ